MAPLDGASTTLRDGETADAFWERTLPEYVSKKWLVKDCTQMYAELNGKLVQCTGFEKFPEPRLHCVVLGATSGETVRLAVTNLADPPEQSEQERRNRCFRILDATRLEWRRVYEAWRSDYDRPDFAARVQHLQDAIYAFEAARPAVELTCGEVGEKVEQIIAGTSVRGTTRDICVPAPARARGARTPPLTAEPPPGRCRRATPTRSSSSATSARDRAAWPARRSSRSRT